MGGLVGSSGGGIIEQTYARGPVTGPGTTGGLLPFEQATTITASYWDTNSTGQMGGTGSVGIGVTTTALQAGLPAGFNLGIWSISPAHTYAFQAFPIGQLNTASYDFSTVAKSDETVTCLAAVFTMTARTVGQLHNDQPLLGTKIDYFWTNPNCAYWWNHYNQTSILWSSAG